MADVYRFNLGLGGATAEQPDPFAFDSPIESDPYLSSAFGLPDMSQGPAVSINKGRWLPETTNYSVDNWPDFLKEAFPNVYGAFKGKDLTPAANNVLAIAGPVGAGAARGYSGLTDLATLGVNQTLPEDYQIPYLGDSLANAIYPEKLRSEVNATANPYLKEAGRIAGTGEEFLTGGQSGAAQLRKLGTLSKGAKYLPKLGQYSPELSKADLYLGLGAGEAGAMAEAITEGTGAGSDAAAQRGDLFQGIASLSPLAWAGLRSGYRGVQKIANKWAGVGNPELAYALSHTPDEIAAVNMEANLKNVQQDAVTQQAAKYALLQDAGGSIPDEGASAAVSNIPIAEQKILKQKLSPFIDSPIVPDAVIGGRTQKDLIAEGADHDANVQRLFEDIADTHADPVELQDGSDPTVVLKQIGKDLSRGIRFTPGKDPMAVRDVTRVIQKITGTKANPAKEPPTIEQWQDLKQGIQNMLPDVDGKSKKVLGEALVKLHDMAPEELQKAWSAQKEFSSIYESVKSNPVSKIVETHEGRTIDPFDVSSGAKPVMHKEEVAALARENKIQNFVDIALIHGEDNTKNLYKASLASELSTELEGFANKAPLGSGSEAISDFVKKTIGRKRTLLNKVYGKDVIDGLEKTLGEAKDLAEVRRVAKVLSSGVSTAGNISTSHIPGGRAGFGIKAPQLIPGTGGFLYSHVADLVDASARMEEARRIQYNQLGSQFGLPQMASRWEEPAYMSDIWSHTARRGGAYADELANIMEQPALTSGAVVLPAKSRDSQPAASQSTAKSGETKPGVYKFNLGLGSSDKKKVEIGADMATTEARQWASKKIDALKEVESGPFGASATSPKGKDIGGYIGEHQLGLAAVKDAAEALGIDPATIDRRNPEQSKMIATEYLAILKDQFGGDKLALAAYNWGRGNVSDLIKRKKTNSWEKLAKYAPEETRDYVDKLG